MKQSTIPEAEIIQAEFTDSPLLEETRFAPYAGYSVFIVNNHYLILEGEVIDGFDIKHYWKIFKVIKTF